MSNFEIIDSLCTKYYATLADNCSGFVAAVAGDLGCALIPPADEMIAKISSDTSWVKVKDGLEAEHFASQGYLVLACLKAADHNPYEGPRVNGHVAIVKSGPFYKGKYPLVWCGGGFDGRSNGKKSVGEVWSRKLKSRDEKTSFAVADRDKVAYFRKMPGLLSDQKPER